MFHGNILFLAINCVSIWLALFAAEDGDDGGITRIRLFKEERMPPPSSIPMAPVKARDSQTLIAVPNGETIAVQQSQLAVDQLYRPCMLRCMSQPVECPSAPPPIFHLPPLPMVPPPPPRRLPMVCPPLPQCPPPQPCPPPPLCPRPSPCPPPPPFRPMPPPPPIQLPMPREELPPPPRIRCLPPPESPSFFESLFSAPPPPPPPMLVRPAQTQNDCCCNCERLCSSTGSASTKNRLATAFGARTRPSWPFRVMDNFALEAIAAEDAQAAKCNNRFLQMAIVENISADLDASKRRIQAAAERALGTAVNVICGASEFTFVVRAVFYCQASGSEERGGGSCYAFTTVPINANVE